MFLFIKVILPFNDIEKYLKKMLDDGNYDILRQAVEKGDFPEAFRASHTLKGICQNLAFARLFESSSLVTKALKENDWNKAVDMMPQLSRDYYEIMNAIEELKRSKEE